MTVAAVQQFDHEVFPAELAEIARRRQTLGLPAPGISKGPAVDHDLLGLALSGGGVRSASLSLGVLQALVSTGVLRKVDYVSTVSGGALIGSAFSSLLNSPGTSPEPASFPLGFELGTAERPAVRYIRDHIKYLAPGGLIDTVRLPAMILRGLISNLAVLLPWLLILVLLTEGAYVLAFKWGPDRVETVPKWIALAFVVLSLAMPVLYRLWPGGLNWARRNALELALTATLIAVFVVILLIPASKLVQDAIEIDWDRALNYVEDHTLNVWVLIGSVILVIVAAARAATGPNRVKNAIGLAALSLLGPGLVFGFYLALTLYEVDSPRLAGRGISQQQLQIDLAGGVVTEPLKQAFSGKGFELDGTARIDPTQSRGAGRSNYTWWVIRQARPPTSWSCTLGRCETTYLVSLWEGELRLINAVLGYDDVAIVLLIVAGLAYGFWFCDQNVTSQHWFFRDRISRAFVLSPEKNGTIASIDPLKLSSLHTPGTAAPYHLVNGTLNLQGARNLDLAGRDADFFFFSRHFVGSPTTGYCPTTDVEKYDRNLDLATAAAVSGAGLAPNTGTTTVGAFVFLTTLLNIRTDYWLPNPAWVRRQRRSFRLRGGVGPIYLLREALGLLDADGAFVNLSDGGGIENLGLCELLRRRCRRIIVVDASEDQTMTFDCLVTAMRYARIDLGIEITIDVNPLRLAGEWSQAHWARGDIDYGRGEHGELIYLKSSLTGDEAEPILAYRRQSPSFPQESSANQFYSESQVEAYRALGEHIARGMLESGDVQWA